ncbi:MAG: GNAT family N-acetyltransferase [Odoribacter sp.]|nr:GNAT family N-acetyltransferase [Odoribacter sp.]
MMIYFETARLLLRDWKEEDIEPFSKVNKDSNVMRYFLKSLTENESLNFYKRIREEFRKYGYGLYSLEKKEDNKFIGYTGFNHIPFDVDFAPGIEIGWRITYEEWDKGYATEAAKACLLYAKENLSLSTIYSFTSFPNKASERVMQKIGMEKVGTFDHPVVPNNHPLKEHVLYKIIV